MRAAAMPAKARAAQAGAPSLTPTLDTTGAIVRVSD